MTVSCAFVYFRVNKNIGQRKTSARIWIEFILIKYSKMSNLAPLLLVIFQEIHTSKHLQNNFRTELE